MASSVKPNPSQTPPSGQGSQTALDWTSPEPQTHEDGEVGRSPEWVEREPLRAVSQVVHGLLEVALLKYPLSQRSQEVEPSNVKPAAHAQVSSERAENGGAHVQLEEALGEDLPIGQTSQTKWLFAARAVEYLEEIRGEAEYLREYNERGAHTYLPGSQPVQAAAPKLDM